MLLTVFHKNESGSYYCVPIIGDREKERVKERGEEARGKGGKGIQFCTVASTASAV
jgi:hypothetical protein